MKRVQPCEGKMQLPDLLWFMCCAREAETERRFKPTRHSACVSAWPASLTCARAVFFSRQPQCALLSPNRQVLEQGRNDAYNSIFRYNLSGSTAFCHANHNKSGKLRGLRKAASRLHACAIAHASFFLPSPLVQCSFYLAI